jgi:hypothetical protein
MRSGCTPSIIPAEGVMCLLNYSSHSTDPFRSAVTFVHDPAATNWRQYAPGEQEQSGAPAWKRIALNLGAPGDFVASDGTLWLAQGVKTRSAIRDLSVRVMVQPDSAKTFSLHPLRVKTVAPASHRAVASSGIEGIESLVVQFGKTSGLQRCTVRLHFLEPRDLEAGDCVFDLRIQGQEFLRDFDAVKNAGGTMRGIVKELHDIETEGDLHIELPAANNEYRPVLCGIDIVRK